MGDEHDEALLSAALIGGSGRHFELPVIAISLGKHTPSDVPCQLHVTAEFEEGVKIAEVTEFTVPRMQERMNT